MPEKQKTLKNISVAAVIAAGGTGTRMEKTVPKQFLELAGKPILLRTIENIASLEEVRQIIVALPEEHIPAAQAILKQQPFRAPVRCIPGGANRQESVGRGAAQIPPGTDIIMVHDAVRPLCDSEMMRRVLESALAKGAAVPGLVATETIQRVSRKGRVLSTPPRQELFAIQTPQAFHYDILISALNRAHAEGFLGTDESSVVRWAGYAVWVVEGSPDNIKITHPVDLDLAELLLLKRSRKKDCMDTGKAKLRVGHGIDYHRFAENRRLIIGGVDIPFSRGLDGHSDADVLSHAICDALLGAAALGDIGQHFPDSDSEHRNRSSLEFLCEVRAKVEAAGWSINNVDATLLAQRPRMMPYVPAMKKNIAGALGISTDEIGIKATTTEGMNAEGRGEGISAQAIALLYKNNTSQPEV